MAKFHPQDGVKGCEAPPESIVALKEVKFKETVSKKAYKDIMNEVEMMKKI